MCMACLRTRRDRRTCEGGSYCHRELLSCSWLSQPLRKQHTPLAKFQSLLPLYVEPVVSFKNTVDGLISETKAHITECGFEQAFPGLGGRLRFGHWRGRAVALSAPFTLAPHGWPLTVLERKPDLPPWSRAQGRCSERGSQVCGSPGRRS